MLTHPGAFGGILAYGIGYMKGLGGLNGWRWIFIIEGILVCLVRLTFVVCHIADYHGQTVVLALGGYWYIADWPSKAKFITEDERALIYARLKADSDATENEAFTWSNVASALSDPKVWLYCACYHSLSLPLYTLSLFLVSSLCRYRLG